MTQPRPSGRFDDAPPRAVRARARRRRRLAALPWIAGLTLLVSALASAAVLLHLRDSEQRARLSELEQLAAERHATVQRDFDRVEDVVTSVEAFFESSQEVTSEEFASFTAPLLARHPEVQALEWAPVVTDAARAAYEEALGRPMTQLDASGRLVPAERRETHAPVTFVEKPEGNATVLGFDLASDPVREAALLRARTTGAAAASRPVLLVQDADAAPAILVIVPHHREGALAGYVVGVLRCQRMLEDALAPLPPAGLTVLLVDPQGPATPLAAMPPRAARDETEGLRKAALEGRLWTRDVSIASTPWRLIVMASPSFLAEGRSWSPWLALATGMLLTALVAGYVMLAWRHASALAREATREPMTGLLNRRGLEDALEAAQARPPVAVILVNFDDFSAVNHAYGFGVGDVVLAEVSNRVKEAVNGDAVVGRLGGDELLLVAAGCDAVAAGALAERIRRRISSTPVLAMPRSVTVTASIGVTVVRDESPSLLQLIAEARAGLRTSKEGGKNRTAFGQDSGQIAAATSARSAMVRHACLESELRVSWEPLVRLVDEATVGHELLVRGPKGELESPAELFRAATEHGVLTQLDMRCLKACVAAAAAGGATGDLHINLLPSTLLAVPVSAIIGALARLPRACRPCIEVNEQQFVSHPSYLVDSIADLREAGVRIAIDDVGSGRGTLDSVLVLKPDVVKIDVSLVRGAFEDVARSQLLGRLVRLCRSLDIEMVAEGVETQGDRDFVRSLGIEHAQGFLWPHREPRSAA